MKLNTCFPDRLLPCFSVKYSDSISPFHLYYFCFSFLTISVFDTNSPFVTCFKKNDFYISSTIVTLFSMFSSVFSFSFLSFIPHHRLCTPYFAFSFFFVHFFKWILVIFFLFFYLYFCLYFFLILYFFFIPLFLFSFFIPIPFSSSLLLFLFSLFLLFL